MIVDFVLSNKHTTGISSTIEKDVAVLEEYRNDGEDRVSKELKYQIDELTTIIRHLKDEELRQLIRNVVIKNRP